MRADDEQDQAMNRVQMWLMDMEHTRWMVNRFRAVHQKQINAGYLAITRSYTIDGLRLIFQLQETENECTVEPVDKHTGR